MNDQPQGTARDGQAVYGEPLYTAAASADGSGTAPGYAVGAPYPPQTPSGAYGYGPLPSATLPGTPNPGLAFALGFIPGVGAMYNGQFAKGLAHVAIFATLVAMANHVSDIFGLGVAGWMAYMVFDAYQTARARRFGMIPPDPFGLNGIGERLGLRGDLGVADFMARPAADASAAPASPAASGAVPPPSTATGYGEPEGAYPPPSHPGAPYAPPYQPAYTAAPVPPPAAVYPVPPPPTSFLPTGALWLIGLGLLALAGSLRGNAFLPDGLIVGLVLATIGVTLFLRVIAESRRLYPAGSATATWHTARSSKGAALLTSAGFLLALSSSSHFPMDRTWPVLLILLGVLLVVERSALNRMLAEQAVAAEAPEPLHDTSLADAARGGEGR